MYPCISELYFANEVLQWHACVVLVCSSCELNALWVLSVCCNNNALARYIPGIVYSSSYPDTGTRALFGTTRIVSILLDK